MTTTTVVVGSTPSVVILPDENPATPVPVPAQPMQVTGPGTNVNGHVPTWNGDDSTALADGLPIGGPGGLVVLDSMGRYPANDASQVLNSPGWITGNVRLTFQITSGPGWVMLNDGTIGDSSSNATTLADASALALFTLFYTVFTDADVPIFTQTGTLTTRATQVSAAIAWAAHCRMSVPKTLGRVLGIAGSGASLTTRRLGSATGAETHTMTTAEMPAHQHTGAAGGLLGTNTVNGNFADLVTVGAGVVSVGINEPTDSAGSGGSFAIMQPTSFINAEVKL